MKVRRELTTKGQSRYKLAQGHRRVQVGIKAAAVQRVPAEVWQPGGLVSGGTL